VKVHYLIDQVPRPADTSTIAKQMFDYLGPYSSPSKNGEREDHLRELSRRGEELRRLIESHPSDWTFGSWEQAGFIMLVPALLKDNEQVADRQIFRTD
jgi:hypothetical protein